MDIPRVQAQKNTRGLNDGLTGSVHVVAGVLVLLS